MAHEQLNLPYAIVTHADVARLLRELQILDDAVSQNMVRGDIDQKLLPTSHLLDSLAEQNRLNLLKPEDRTTIKTFLEYLRKSAPLLHFSFSSDPSPRFTNSLITWLRQEIHPLVLLRIGLEPSIGAGCILRTTNRSFDFSLRHHFEDQRSLLVAKIKEGEA